MAANAFSLVNGQQIIDKHPESTLDYGVKLYRWLVSGDSLTGGSAVAPVWTCSAGLQIVSSGIGTDGFGPTAFAFISGGLEADALEWASVTWTTNQGRVEVQTLYFNMVPGTPADSPPP